MDPEQLGIPQYVENLFGLEPPRLHLPLQPLYVETLLLLHRAGPTNSGEGPRTEVGGGESTELRRGDQELARGGGGREHRISAGSTEVRSDLNGRVAANYPPGVCGGWYHLLNTILLDLGQASKQAITRSSPEVVLVGRAEQRHQLFQ